MPSNPISVPLSGTLLYAAELNFNKIWVFDIKTKCAIRWIGGYGRERGKLSGPMSLCVTRGGNIMVAEKINKRVQVRP